MRLSSWWDAMTGRLAVARSLFRFLWMYRLWWMIPLVSVLLVFGALLLIAQQSVVAPFIYTLF